MIKPTFSHLHWRAGYENVPTELLSSYQMLVIPVGICYVRKTYDNGRCNQAVVGCIVNGKHFQRVERYRLQNPPSQWRLCHAIDFAERKARKTEGAFNG